MRTCFPFLVLKVLFRSDFSADDSDSRCAKYEVFHFSDLVIYTEEITAGKVSKYRVFLVRIFLYSDRTRRFTVFSPNTGKCVPEITPYLDTFHAVNP